MKILSFVSSAIALQRPSRGEPPAYPIIPEQVLYPALGAPDDAYLPIFQVDISRFFGQAFYCRPDKYKPWMPRWGNGRRDVPLVVFPPALRANPFLAMQGLRQLARPPMSWFWDYRGHIQEFLDVSVYPSLVDYLKDTPLTSANAHELQQTIDALARLDRGRQAEGLASLRAEFDHAQKVANMAYDQGADRWEASPRCLNESLYKAENFNFSSKTQLQPPSERR